MSLAKTVVKAKASYYGRYAQFPRVIKLSSDAYTQLVKESFIDKGKNNTEVQYAGCKVVVTDELPKNVSFEFEPPKEE